MYRIIFLFIFFLSIAKNSFSQSESKRVPFYLSYSVKGITRNLCKNKESDSLKLRAIYTWITHNIRYDLKAYLRYSEKKYTPRKILFRRKVVCQGYSDLFRSMCNHAGIRCLEVTGYAKGGIDYQRGQEFYWEEHAWNAVEINGKWHVLDLTWGSGYIALKKRRIRKFLMHTFGLPYLQNKVKFKSSPNDDYYLASAEIMLKDHLPADPVFQLQRYPVSIVSFEKNKAMLSNDSLDFEELIDSVKYIPYGESQVVHAKKGKKFNKKNNKIVGYAYSQYGIALLKSLPPSLNVNSASQVALCEQAAKYLTEALPALSRFKQDNAVVHKIRMDSITNRNNLIRTNVLQFYSINRPIRSKDIIGLGSIKVRIKGYKRSVRNLRKQYVRLTSGGIGHVQGNFDIKKYKPELINKWKVEIETNNKKIKILSDTSFRKNEKIHSLIDSMETGSVNANETYIENYSLIYENIQLNIMKTPLGLLKKNYVTIHDNKKLRDAHLRKIATTALQPMGRKQKERYSSLSQIMKLIADNKKNLIRIKKMNIQDEGEEMFYEEENKRLFSVYLNVLEYYEELTSTSVIEFNRMLTELGHIKSENKLLKKELRVQALRYKTETRRENFRYRLFNQRADQRIKLCKQGIGFAKKRILVLKRILKVK
jgi:hypothetical protein